MRTIENNDGIQWNPNETVFLNKLFLYKNWTTNNYDLFLEVSCQKRISKQNSWPDFLGVFEIRYLIFNDVCGLNFDSFGGGIMQVQDCEILDHSTDKWEKRYEFITENGFIFYFSDIEIKNNNDFLKNIIFGNESK